MMCQEIAESPRGQIGLVLADKSSANDRDGSRKQLNKWKKILGFSRVLFQHLYSSMSDSSITALILLRLQTYDLGESKIPSTSVGSLHALMLWSHFQIQKEINNRLMSTGMEHKNRGITISYQLILSLL